METLIYLSRSFIIREILRSHCKARLSTLPIYDFDLRATHARTLLLADLESVSFGFILVRVRVLCRGRRVARLRDTNSYENRGDAGDFKGGAIFFLASLP